MDKIFAFSMIFIPVFGLIGFFLSMMFDSYVGGFGLAGIAIIVICGVYFDKKNKNKFKDVLLKEQKTFLNGLPQDNIDFSEFNTNETAYIGISIKQKRVLFVWLDGYGNILSRTIEAKDIKDIELCENGNGILNLSQSQTQSLAGAAAGGLLFGGAGAVVGAIAGQNRDKITDISLVFRLNDYNMPFQKFDFMDEHLSFSRGSMVHKLVAEKAQNTFGRIELLIDDKLSNPSVEL